MKLFLKYFIPLFGLAMVLVHWQTHVVKPNNLLFDVNELWRVSFFETKNLYFYLHLLPLMPILTFSVFDKKVLFPKTWKALFPALAIVAVVFWAWDSWKTSVGVWGFNPRYYTFKIGHLPIEEWCFFFTFPWAIMFFYHSLNVFLPKNRFFKSLEHPLSIFLIFLFFGIGFSNWGKTYTATTSIAAAIVLLWQFIFDNKTNFRADFYRVFVVGLIPFVLTNGILTGIATEQPVVVYNPEEYLGIRFFTIPLDDFIYNFALLFSVTWLYEWFNGKKMTKISTPQ
jgi:lycopene cyclase domain-containing protein